MTFRRRACASLLAVVICALSLTYITVIYNFQSPINLLWMMVFPVMLAMFVFDTVLIRFLMGAVLLIVSLVTSTFLGVWLGYP